MRDPFSERGGRRKADPGDERTRHAGRGSIVLMRYGIYVENKSFNTSYIAFNRKNILLSVGVSAVTAAPAG
jgi:hypothetical protein